MIKLGNRTHVQPADLWAVSAADSSPVNIASFEPIWLAERAAAAIGETAIVLTLSLHPY